MLVDITQLTENQTAGLTYEYQRLNVALAAENEGITQYNASRPVSEPEKALKELYTLETYAAKMLTDKADQAYQNLLAYKETIFKQKFYEADAETQNSVLTTLGVPDVVQA